MVRAGFRVASMQSRYSLLHLSDSVQFDGIDPALANPLAD